jgi:hypothetical protein
VSSDGWVLRDIVDAAVYEINVYVASKCLPVEDLALLVCEVGNN